jgi:TPR repeat protein
MRKNGIDIKPDHAKAIDQLLSAAGKGNSIAGMHLIFGYDYGNGMKKSDYDAFKAFASVVISKDK